MRKLTLWALIGSLWTAWWLFILIWITWYDYPRTKDIYAGFLGDGTWFWHEIAIPLAIWLSGMAFLMITSFWYHAIRFLDGMSKVVILPDAQPIRVVIRRRIDGGSRKQDIPDTTDRKEAVPDNSTRYDEASDRARLLHWFGPH